MRNLSGKFNRLLTGIIISLLILGACPQLPSDRCGAEVKPKIKKVVSKKKIVSKKAPKKVVRKKIVKRPRRVAPKGPQIISQNYYLEENPDEIEAENLVVEVKGLGANEAQVNTEKNVLHVKYSDKNLSTVRIIQKLKELGYTVKRIQ